MTVTEDQARAGGCCSCPDPCGGVDLDNTARARGVNECSTSCTWCMHGCPIPGTLPCLCLRLPKAPR